ncbi:MAG TPA: Gfo/Idh/MocA family oxidoreductase [Gemmataceae bacterium]|nr:Gfo/Idh/MocA family oxidoreductase [Gemmataceae bacterium]
MTRSTRVSRRQFLRSVAAAGLAGPLVFTAPLRAAPSERITLGFIGVGTMGRGHLGSFLGRPDVQVVAVCDVVAERRASAQKMVEDRYAAEKGKGTFKGCAAYNDFRELLDRKDIDAVVIATPDHWHAIPCVLAAQAGKDIYCEKPLTHNIAEGRKIVETVKKHKVVFQTGSQQRSEFGGRFRTAVELVRNGRIGKVKTIRIGVGGPAVPCDLPEEPVPEGTDWDMWLGPAPKRGYNEILCPKGVHKHFPAWRRYREYAGGGLADMGAHHFDIAQWALDMDNSGPVLVEPPADPKAASGLKYTYANGVVMFHNVFEGPRADCVFEGSDGVILVSRGSLASKPEEILKQPLTEKDYRVYPSNDHRRNWLECIKSRKDPICTAEIGHRSATVCHLGNIGYWLRRPLRWDPAQERFTNDEEANRLLSREMRPPWKL